MNKAISQLPLRISFLLLFCLCFISSYAFEVVCPADVSINCDEDIYDLSAYGQAQYHDYTGWHDAGYPTVAYNLDNCGLGEIIRTWSVYNPYAQAYVSCSQVLDVSGTSFGYNNITWPQTDLDLSGCNPDLSPNALPSGYQTPTWTAGTCAIIGSSYTDKVFFFDGACKKVIRTWEIINCCIYNPYTGHGSWTYNQEINVTISDVPDITCPEDVEVESYDCSGVYVEVPGIIVPDTECSDVVTVMNDSPYSSGGADASGTYPIGTTLVTFTADYGCWQKTMCQIEVIVTDATAPTPYCIYGLSVALMGIDTDGDGTNDEGMVQVWASDLDKGSYASCNSNSDLIFSFSSDIQDTYREFTCDDVGRNDLEVWVTDEQGRQNYCTTYIRVQNNAAEIEDCEDADDYSRISGHVQSHHGESMGSMQLRAVATGHEGTEIYLQEMVITEVIYDSTINSTGVPIYFFKYDTTYNTITEMEYPTEEFLTDKNSEMYEFEYLPHYNDYTVHGVAYDHQNKLINRADIVYIRDYIDGKRSFTSYQKMAADVNKDGEIDNEDVTILQSVINGNAPSDFDTRWHFMDTGFDLENMDEDHECEEFCRVQDLKEDTYKVNLIGYRVGDVTNLEISSTTFMTNVDSGTEIHKRNSISNTIKLSISPNPFTDFVTLKVQIKNASKAEMRILNEVGQLVDTKQLDLKSGSNEIAVNLSDLSNSGIYLYEIQIGSVLRTGKLVKVK